MSALHSQGRGLGDIVFSTNALMIGLVAVFGVAGSYEQQV